MSAAPSVAIVVPSWNGAAHLPDCLDSLAALDYPQDRLEVVVVDNGSTDGSRELLATAYPRARVVALPENVGFAEASNTGARETGAECVAFLNNDMRVDPRWLAELVALYEPEAGYVCVAGLILDWAGERIDFVSGYVNFHGAGGQEYFKRPLDDALVEDGRDLLFACGGSLLVRRDVFLRLGGFDPAYFAFFEDVDLGWRLWLAGYRVRLAGKARSFHRIHGTALGLPRHQRALMYERNALLTLLKNVGDENLAPLLAAALFLLIERATLESGSERSAFEPGVAGEEVESVPRAALAGLHAASGVLAQLAPALERRREVQRLRTRSDEEIFALFARPFAPLRLEESYLEASLQLRAALGLERLFTRQRAARLLVVGRGDSERLQRIACGASALAPVVLACPGRPPPLADVAAVRVRRDLELEGLLAECDLVIAEGGSAHAETVREHARGVLAVDLDGRSGTLRPELLERGDVFLCSSAEDRVRWLDALGRLGRRAGGEGGDPPLVVVVPDGDEGERRAALRAIVEEPWRWTEARRGPAPAAHPEDALRLLRAWRDRYARESTGRRAARTVWRRLPTRAQEGVRRLLGRPGA